MIHLTITPLRASFRMVARAVPCGQPVAVITTRGDAMRVVIPEHKWPPAYRRDIREVMREEAPSGDQRAILLLPPEDRALLQGMELLIQDVRLLRRLVLFRKHNAWCARVGWFYAYLNRISGGLFARVVLRDPEPTRPELTEVDFGNPTVRQPARDMGALSE